MSGKFNLAIVLLLLAISASSSEALSRCQFVNSLKKFNLPTKDIQNYACIAQFTTDFDTSVINKQSHKDGSWDWGIFQINDKDWCDGVLNPNGPKGANKCGTECSNLLVAGEAIRCAKIIVAEKGFDYWKVYKDYKENCDNFEIEDCPPPKTYQPPTLDQIYVSGSASRPPAPAAPKSQKKKDEL